ncbi:hypothetical protein [Pedobacter suwonensis]|uniref:hypothetical protein n=1 Tax=Pedobacter suwonensis TaxID=332999 RepID=UPI0011A936E5|nr:hypothetical protein [Pedobacter suwonensis]
MYPVFNNSSQIGHSADSLQESLIEICNSHRNADRALAFAFILYDFTNPQVSKVLHDSDYWMALNEISGKYLTVFSIHKSSKSEGESNKLAKPEIAMAYMTGFSSVERPELTTDQIITRYFDADFKVEYPAILFFQVDEMEVVDGVMIGLNEEKLEDAYLEIQSYIRSAVKALAKIEPESKGNFQEIFNQLEGNVKQNRNARVIRKFTKKGVNLLGIVSSVVGFV